MPPSEGRIRPSDRIGRRLTLTFVALVMVLIAGTGWALHGLTRRSLEREMGDRLETAARLVAGGLDGDVVRRLRPGDESFRVHASLTARLRKARDMVGARRIYVFDRQGRSLLDTEPGVPVGREYARLRIDRAEMDSVWRGRPALSPLFQDADGAYYQSGYAPVFAEADPVAGVGVDLGAAFLETIHAFGRSVLALGVAGAALTVALGLGMARTITGPVRRLASAAREIGNGNLETPVAVSSRDEIGILAETMEEMRRGILSRDDRLRQMLAGVAHEIRNPLGGIELYAGLIADDLPDADPRKAHIRKVIGEVRNLNRIISEFLDFARPGHPHPTSTPVSALVEEAAFPLRPEMEEAGVAYRQDVPEGLQARVDPEPVKRALLNLMKNALQAMPGGGNLTVRARGDGSRVRVEVQDDGPGIPPEALERIFEPFYTTKPQGSGLGLAIVRKIAEENGGGVEAESEVGKGARFSVVLPGT